VIADLGLRRRGFETTVFEPQLWVPLDDGNVFVEWSDDHKTADALERWSPGSSRGLEAMGEVGDLVFRAIRGDGDQWDDLWLREDPPTPDEVRDRLGSEIAVRAVFEDSMVDFVGQFFDDNRVVDALAGQGVIGETTSPRDPGTAWVYLHHSLGRATGDHGSWGLVHGGIGIVSFALAEAALEAGALIVTDAAVSRIMPGVGVMLEDSTEIRARAVVSNADPIRTARLVGEDLEARSIVGASAKVNLALSAPVPFADDSAHTAMVNVGASVDVLHSSARQAGEGELSERLWAEVYTQTTLDHTVAPPGKHLLSCFVQYVPYRLKNGWGDRSRDEVAKRVIAEIQRHAPGFSELVERYEVSVPPDIEDKIGLTGGHIFQGDCTPDRMWSNRPDYKTDLAGVYLCGAGTHPGGSVIAVNGRNAAMRVLRDLN
jgi:phytoene dehydrogenase-like protein